MSAYTRCHRGGTVCVKGDREDGKNAAVGDFGLCYGTRLHIVGLR